MPDLGVIAIMGGRMLTGTRNPTVELYHVEKNTWSAAEWQLPFSGPDAVLSVHYCVSTGHLTVLGPNASFELAVRAGSKAWKQIS